MSRSCPVRRPHRAANRIRVRLTLASLILLIGATAGQPSAGAESALAAQASLTERTGRIEVEAMEYPWSAIGRVNVGGRGHCTGFLIGERGVLTAAHCLFDARERRWRGAEELHFVAGYQRDAYIIHAPVAGYTRARGYDPLAAHTPEAALDDWAVLTLARPIGRQAGWLGLREADPDLAAQIRRGAATIVQAGYRRGWIHIMSVGLNCEMKGTFGAGRGIAHACDLSEGDSGSPLLVLSGGEVSAIGLHVIDMHTKQGHLAGALSTALFRPGRGRAEAAKALRASGAEWGHGQAPADGGPATARPIKTVEALLGNMGLLEPGPGAGEAERRDAIAAFERDSGLPVTGIASLNLLGRLIAASE